MIRSAPLALMVCLVIGSFASAEEPKKPQWQRMLNSEDAKKAKNLQSQILRLESLGNQPEAAKVAEELLVFREQKQGTDHYEVTDARLRLSDLQKELTAEEVAQLRRAGQFHKIASNLDDKSKHAEAHPLYQKALVLQR